MEESALQFMMQLLTTAEMHHLLLVLITLAATPFGVVAMVVWLWIGSERRRNETIRIYRDDIQKVLTQYGEDMKQLKDFYASNVELVKAWKRLADGLQDTVVLNTQVMTRMCDLIKGNLIRNNPHHKNQMD